MNDLPKSSMATWKAMLKATPLRNRAAIEVPAEDGSCSVAVSTKKPAWAVPPITWVAHVPDRKTLVLDRLGTEVWKACDGATSVEAIVVAFARRHRLTFHESRVSVTGCLKVLIQRGALAVTMEEPCR